jgi:hypothetical protein
MFICMTGLSRLRDFSKDARRSKMHGEQGPWEGTVMSDVAKPAARKHDSFAEFYPFYLSEHSDRTCRRLHFAGSSLALLCVIAAVVTRNPWWLAAALVCGYGFAWIGHFAFEKNQPASFKQPLYSLMGDWKMWWQTVTGKIAF